MPNKKRKFDKNAPRYRAGRGELQGGTGGITKMCPAVDYLEVYKVDKTFRIYTPESLDPEETDPNMGWMSKPVADVGSANKIVARVFIQASEAITNAPLATGISKDDILRCMHRCKEHLLICEDKQKWVCKETERICQLCSKGELKKEGYHVVDFPQIDHLEEYCAAFLSNAKLTIQTLAELINKFYKTYFDGPRFDKIVKWSKKALKHNEHFMQCLEKNQPGLKFIVELRNAQEHPKDNRKLIIENFILKPGNRISIPHWYINGEESSPIHSTMVAMIDFLTAVTENIFLHCVMDNINSSFPFIVRVKDDSSLDPNCPIKYSIEPNIMMNKDNSPK
ncbi:MAG: hypothetical protein KJ757_02815 [Planctomycetes bacterium]|nr:hypothetical protein [Planctomycetota bacterium]MBU1517374.1 hypothetical protein [Planctomycetota bacterium]MBU2458156.1 hypothetical protein [Planctomycetota bacterium]MBU2596482.1 hypothetical protein [Planctomycetota bacterium]